MAFYATSDSSQESLIQGFSMADITLCHHEFVTNLLTRSDSSFMIGRRSKDGSIIMRLCDQCILQLLPLYRAWIQVVDFISVGLPFLVIVLDENLSGQGIVEVLD